MKAKAIMDGVFAINKPPGLTSRQCLDKVNRALSNAKCSQIALQKLKDDRDQHSKNRIKKYKTKKLKMGHGGTLDPLAEGVLILGVGKGTKKLGEYTNGATKVYDATGLFGGSTTSGDADGQLIETTDNEGLKREDLDDIPQRFIGTLNQTPPIFSALKMDGMPLYEYARKGLPLPRPIKARTVHVYDLKLSDDCLSTDHNYEFIKSEVDEDGSTLVDKLKGNPTLNDHPVSFSEEYMKKAAAESLSTETLPVKVVDPHKYEVPGYRAPLLRFASTVSSGTYVRSLLSDFARALGRSAYIVKLVRERQAEWQLGKNCFQPADFDLPEGVWEPVLQKVLREGPEINVKLELEESRKKYEETAEKEAKDEDGAKDATATV